METICGIYIIEGLFFPFPSLSLLLFFVLLSIFSLSFCFFQEDQLWKVFNGIYT